MSTRLAEFVNKIRDLPGIVDVYATEESLALVVCFQPSSRTPMFKRIVSYEVIEYSNNNIDDLIKHIFSDFHHQVAEYLANTGLSLQKMDVHTHHGITQLAYPTVTGNSLNQPFEWNVGDEESITSTQLPLTYAEILKARNQLRRLTDDPMWSTLDIVQITPGEVI